MKIGKITTDYPENLYAEALNSFVLRDRWTFIRKAGPNGEDISLADFVKEIDKNNDLDLSIEDMNDWEVSELMADNLDYGIDAPAGVVAWLYMASWVASALRERLEAYESLADLCVDHDGKYSLLVKEGKNET